MYSRGCRNKEKGAITVFLALIFMSLIIFAGAVIDIVRIAAAERKVQSALNTSARSVLAGYDTELMGGYGIYGINTGTEAVKDEFYRYLCVNLKEQHKGISLIDIKIDKDNVEIQGMDSLLSDDAFKRQVQEYMKYRMPITVTDSLMEQLQNIKLDKKVEFAKNEKVTRDMARELRTKAKDVNAKLVGIKKKMIDISAEKLEDISNELSEILKISSSIYGENGEGLLGDYTDSKEATNDKAKEGDCIENQSDEFANIIENSETLMPELQAYISEINRTIGIVRPLERDIEDLEEELEELEEELEAAEEDSTDIEQEIEEIKEEIESLESEIEGEISELSAKLESFSVEGYSLRDESIQLNDRKTEELKDFIGKKKDEIAKALLSRLEKQWLISAEEFNNSNLAVSENFSVMDEGARYSSTMSEDEAEKSSDTIIRNMNRLAKAVEYAASSTVEKISTIEYVLDKYTFLTSKTERNHYFRKGEVEYIISGSDIGAAYNPIRNTEYYIVTDVLLQVWALRFAIDALDSFVRSPIIFPPQRLAFALTEGALDSSMDMCNMLNGEDVPICPKSFTAVRLKYSDHLKILLLMKPEGEILRKARQLMQVNIKNVVDARTGLPRHDFKMGEYSTVISATVTAKVNLFFLPLLKLDSLMPDSFEGGRYKIRKQIHLGY